MGVTLSAAGSLQWYRDTLAPGGASRRSSPRPRRPRPAARACCSCPTSPASARLSRSRSRRVRRSHPAPSRAHLTRAVLEGVAFSMRDALELEVAPDRSVCRPRSARPAVASRARVWRQILADVLKMPRGDDLDVGGCGPGCGDARGGRRGVVPHRRGRLQRAGSGSAKRRSASDHRATYAAAVRRDIESCIRLSRPRSTPPDPGLASRRRRSRRSPACWRRRPRVGSASGRPRAPRAAKRSAWIAYWSAGSNVSTSVSGCTGGSPPDVTNTSGGQIRWDVEGDLDGRSAPRCRRCARVDLARLASST